MILQVQNNKQLLSALRRKARDRDIEPYRVPDPTTRINARWTNEELLLAVQGKKTNNVFRWEPAR